jgi:hypothetical protein
VSDDVDNQVDEYPDKELLALTGIVAYREFESAPEYSKERLRARLVELTTLSDEEFVRACESAIYDSALMQRFRGNHEDVHCLATVCYYQSELRKTLLHGHEVECNAETLYTRAYDAVISRHGMNPGEHPPCECPNTREK